MGHSVGGYVLGGPGYGPAHTKAFHAGMHKVYSLRNDRNRPVTTIQVINQGSEDRPYTVVKQIRGNGARTGNTAPANYDVEVVDFLSQVIKPDAVLENNEHLTPLLIKYKKSLGPPAPPRPFADGGSVDETPQLDARGRLIDDREEIRSESRRMLNRLQSQPSKLPPGLRRAIAGTRAQGRESMAPEAAPARGRGVSSLPGYGQPTALSEAVSGFVGAPRRFSVMDPQAQRMQQARDLGEQASVASQLYGALTPFAAGATMARAGQMAGISPLTVYHGSPHRFSKFDASKIGTGEGTQVYGHGLYFAEAPKVAKQYQKNLSNSNYVNAITGNLVESGKAWADALKAVQNTKINKVQHPDRAGAIASQIQDWVDSGRTARSFLLNHRVLKDLEPAYEAAINSFDVYRKNKGSFYTVDLPDEKIARMLDWDKPLSQQPHIPDIGGVAAKWAARYAEENRPEKFNGANFLAHLRDEFGGEAQAAEALRQAGIPGIKYFDSASRNRPLKDIKREFLNELPEDAGIDEVVELLGTGTFSPKNEAIIKELAANDWLGFSYPAQALSEALGPSIRNYEVSPSLMRAINEAREGGTRNFVLFPGEEQNIKMLKIE